MSHWSHYVSLIVHLSSSWFESLNLFVDADTLYYQVIGEMDMDDDGTISFMDFKHGMSKQAAFQE